MDTVASPAADPGYEPTSSDNVKTNGTTVPPLRADDQQMTTNHEGNDNDVAFLQPRPRHPKSPAHSAQIRVQNRRREYLERNPAYFEGSEHESADPIVYDTLIRRFQPPEEREREGRAKGYSRTLEMDILRGEARVSRAERAAACWEGRRREEMANSATETGEEPSDSSMMPPPPAPRRKTDEQERAEEQDGGSGSNGPLDRDALATMRTQEDEDEEFVAGAIAAMSSTAAGLDASSAGGSNAHGQGGNNNNNPYVEASSSGSASAATQQAAALAAESREEGRTRWREFLRRRFVLGKDDDFDYRGVDEDDELDVLERREQEERWFEDEEPDWVGVEEEEKEEEHKGKERKGRKLEGETGIQDY